MRPWSLQAHCGGITRDFFSALAFLLCPIRWWCSIRVPARGTKDGISVGKWIEEQCATLGESLVGQRLQVYWPREDAFFRGKVVKYEGKEDPTKVGCFHTIQ